MGFLLSIKLNGTVIVIIIIIIIKMVAPLDIDILQLFVIVTC